MRFLGLGVFDFNLLENCIFFLFHLIFTRNTICELIGATRIWIPSSIAKLIGGRVVYIYTIKITYFYILGEDPLSRQHTSVLITPFFNEDN
jgi:hypothetical protein